MLSCLSVLLPTGSSAKTSKPLTNDRNYFFWRGEPQTLASSFKYRGRIKVGVFDSPEEIRERREKAFKVLFSLLIIAGVIIGAYALFDAYKPLPQTERCAEQGFMAGNIIKGKEYCYERCEGNDLSSCRVVRRLI